MPPLPQRRNCADLDRRLRGTVSIGLVENLAGATQSAPANDGTPVTAEAARGFWDRLAPTTGRRGSKGLLIVALCIGAVGAGIRRSNAPADRRAASGGTQNEAALSRSSTLHDLAEAT